MEENIQQELKSSGNLKLFLPDNGQSINVDSDEEVAIITQQRFREEGLLSWIIWTKGD